MIVCSCNVLSDKTIRSCLKPGPDCPYTAAQVYRCLGCSPQCGRCARTIRAIVNDTLPSIHVQCDAVCSARCPLSEGDGEPIAVAQDTVSVDGDTIGSHLNGANDEHVEAVTA